MKEKSAIAVVGCINRDTVRYPGKPVVRGFGGILYNIFGLSQLLGDSTRIVPVCNLGHDVAREVLDLLSPLRNVNKDNIRIVPTVNNHCEMTYRADSERDETFTGFVPAISFDQLARIADCDLVLVNFISGRDLTLNTFKRFRRMFYKTIYFDFHTLSLGLRRDGRRFFRKPKGWAEYLECCNYLQMNRAEFNLLSGQQAQEHHGRQPGHLSDRSSLMRFFKQHVQPTASAMLVTLGSDGAAMVTGKGRRVGVTHEIPVDTAETLDTTGAGDLFAAGFCAGFTQGNSLVKCLSLAVETATHGCTARHPQDLTLSAIQ